MDLKTKNKPKPKTKPKPKNPKQTEKKKKEPNPGLAWRIRYGTVLGCVCWILESPRELLKGKKKFPARWEFLWKNPCNGRFKSCIEIAMSAKSPLLQWVTSCLLREIIQSTSPELARTCPPCLAHSSNKGSGLCSRFHSCLQTDPGASHCGPKRWPTPSLGNCERYKLFWWRWPLRFALPFGHLYELNHLLSKRLGHTGWSLYEYENLLLTK